MRSYLLDSIGDQVELLDVDQGVQALDHTDAVEREVQVHQVREVPEILKGSDAVVVELQFFQSVVVVQALYLLDQVLTQAEFLKGEIPIITLRLAHLSSPSILGILYIMEYSISSLSGGTGHSSLPRKL